MLKQKKLIKLTDGERLLRGLLMFISTYLISMLLIKKGLDMKYALPISYISCLILCTLVIKLISIIKIVKK